jgi:hypothetical protein
MAAQAYEWTCSVCSLTWCLQSTGTAYVGDDVYDARAQAGVQLGYPDCIDEVYGLKSAACLVDVFAGYGLSARQAWVTFDQAYAIAAQTTGCINPIGMYHFMAIRGADQGAIAVANSAPGYMGVYSSLDRAQFNALGPVQVIYLDNPQP